MLFDSQPLVIDPDLAVKVGLNDAIVLQQIHYWIMINKKAGKNFKDGYYWTYNSLPAWQEQFPFWSKNTIQRTLTKLKNNNLIVVTNKYNKLKQDRTNWYRINYEELNRLKEENKKEEQASIPENGFKLLKEGLKNSNNSKKDK